MDPILGHDAYFHAAQSLSSNTLSSGCTASGLVRQCLHVAQPTPLTALKVTFMPSLISDASL